MPDPWITAAERCALGILDPVAPLRGPAIKGPHPHTIAYPGYVNHWGAARFYYLSAGGAWLDTETDKPWPGEGGKAPT